MTKDIPTLKPKVWDIFLEYEVRIVEMEDTMLIVKKFGGSSVADKDRIFNVAQRCIEDYNKGHQVVVVLSAMGKQQMDY